MLCSDKKEKVLALERFSSIHFKLLSNIFIPSLDTCHTSSIRKKILCMYPNATFHNKVIISILDSGCQFLHALKLLVENLTFIFSKIVTHKWSQLCCLLNV